jgi:hypothetical protein
VLLMDMIPRGLPAKIVLNVSSSNEYVALPQAKRRIWG